MVFSTPEPSAGVFVTTGPSMAVLNGTFARRNSGGAIYPQLSSHLTGYENGTDVATHPHVSASQQSELSTATRQGPIAAGVQRLAGVKARSYVDDFYHRFHVTPAVIDMGNVVSAQTSIVSLWNAYLQPKQLQDVSGVESGLEVLYPFALPCELPALQESNWQVTVTPDGPSALDAWIQWDFSEAPAVKLHITGNRIVPWGFAPDWSSNITERLEWLTDVLSSPQGGEQRRALRISPRRSWDAAMLVEGTERALFDLALAGWGRRVWAVPVWYDAQELATDLAAGSMRINCSVALLDFRAGGLAMLRGDTAFDTEAVEILAIDANGLQLKRATQQRWPAGTRLYPVRTARIASIDSKRLTDKLNRAQLTFDLAESSDWTASLPVAMYRGRPVFELRPDETEDLTLNYERLLQTLDNGSALPAVTDTAGRNFSVQQHRWALEGRKERAAWRGLVYGLRGRAKSVWVPTHAWDLQLTKPASGSLLTVERIGYARFGVKTQGRQDIRIEMHSGAVIYRRITAAAEDAGTESLNLDADLPGAINPADVWRISFMSLCRAADDALELTHVTDSDGGLAKASITWRGVRDDLETV